MGNTVTDIVSFYNSFLGAKNEKQVTQQQLNELGGPYAVIIFLIIIRKMFKKDWHDSLCIYKTASKARLDLLNTICLEINFTALVVLVAITPLVKTVFSSSQLKYKFICIQNKSLASDG